MATLAHTRRATLGGAHAAAACSLSSAASARGALLALGAPRAAPGEATSRVASRRTRHARAPAHGPRR